MGGAGRNCYASCALALPRRFSSCPVHRDPRHLRFPLPPIGVLCNLLSFSASCSLTSFIVLLPAGCFLHAAIWRVDVAERAEAGRAGRVSAPSQHFYHHRRSAIRWPQSLSAAAWAYASRGRTPNNHLYARRGHHFSL